MFYRTQIKAVTDFGVVDMAGKKLRFVGYLPVKAGDWVFTDGTFIFGNVPPRGSPATFGEDPAGVPVLGDDLRGYFSRNGSFKNYPVKQDNWLVNFDKKFAHGSEDNVIDAELADDGSLLTVEKNPIQISDRDEVFNVLFYHYCFNSPLVGLWHGYLIEYYSMQFLNTGIRGSECSVTASHFWITTLENGIQSFDYFKNDEVIKDCELIIRKDGNEMKIINLSDIVLPAEEFAWSYINVDIPYSSEESHIKSGAILLNFKIAPDGKWSALFKIEIGAEHLYFDDTAVAVALEDCAPRSSIAVHSLLLFKVDSDGNAQKLAEYSEFMPLWHRHNYANHGKRSEYYETVAIGFPFRSWASKNRVYALNPDTGQTTFVEAEWVSMFIYDSHLMENAPDYENPKIEFIDSFSFPVQDNFQARFTNAEEDIDKWTLDGIFDSDNKEIIGAFLPDETDAHTWNMGCASLKGGSCLFGTHDKALYKIDRDGNSELVGDNLKNFRLRELKKISKSRR